MQVYVVMGVSGVGKTTIGKMLAERLQVPFYDADDFHSQANVKLMREGKPLKDNHRQAWLEELAKNIREWHKDKGAVLACSALKKKYREQLSSIPEEDLTWIFLHSEYEVIYERIASRKDHYFKPEMLQSQYDILEQPDSGVHVDVQATQDEIIEEIMEKIAAKEKGSQIGIIGLGVMGKSLALNFGSRGIKTSVFNRHVEELEVDIAKNFAQESRDIFDFPWFDDLQKFVASLKAPRNILLMVNAGKAVDLVIEGLLPFLDKGDLIIDGGNSHFKDTNRREAFLKEKGMLFMGTGISGGEEGARKGPSIMPGGPQEAYERAGKLLEEIAAKDKNGKACCTHVGPGGSGHFVKMLHNGIEYGEMQLIAETYHFLRFSFSLSTEEIADLFAEWNREMRSFLLEITIDILQKKENDDYLIDKVLDAAKQKGTGGWSTNAALELGVPLDTITAAVLARNISGRKQDRLTAEEVYQRKQHGSVKNGNFSELFEAYKSASIINHAIGFDLLLAASKEYDWNLNLSEIARIWTNGCIIRSGLMEELVMLFRENSKHLLLHKQIVEEMKQQLPKLASVTADALEKGFPMPLMSSALNYFYSFTAAQSSANMIQAQRDYFGAHTYERTDELRGRFFHSDWGEKED
ncbi:MAG: NADP-dependent phosphogluconate dehydrogenase [Salinimicrobium sp.]